MAATTPAAPRPSRLRRGDPGLWAAVLHRITGAAIFFFLFVHVLDTVMVRVGPQAYTEVVAIYQRPLVALLELLLVAAVLYHGLNGIRVILTDLWSPGAGVQRALRWLVAAVWLLVMTPAGVVIVVHLMENVR